MKKLILLTILSVLFISDAYSYTLQRAEKSSILTGYTRAFASMTVVAESSGRLISVNYGMGDVIGQKVFAIIDPFFTKQSIKSVETSIRKLEAVSARIENNITYLKKEYNRIESLYLSEVETESRRDGAKQALDQAELSLSETEAEKASLMVSLDELRERLRREYIKVPPGWLVTSKPLEKSELVNVGTPIATAGDFRKLIIPLFVSDAELAFFQQDSEIKLTLNGKNEKAKLHRINPAFDERTRKRQVELLINKSGVGGMLAEIPASVPTEGLMVDERALLSRYANPKVKIKSTGKLVDVQILGKNGGKVILAETSLLEAGIELAEFDR